MTARPKGDRWYADFTHAGARYREFGFASELEAASWEAQARVSLVKGLPLPSGPTATKPKLMAIKDHVQYCHRAQWAAQGSGVKSARNAEHFAEFVGPYLPVSEALTTANITEYVEDLKVNELSGGTINRRLAAISVLVKHALALNLIDRAPLLTWEPEGRGRKRYFTRDEVAQIVATTRQWGYHLEAGFFCFLVDTGARVGEALGVDVRTCLTDTRVTFLKTKNGRDRTIPLTARASAAIRMAPRGFQTLNRWGLRSLWERLRSHHTWIGSASLHTFRHTCASWLVQSGVDLYRVKEWMGHLSIVTTQIYAHLSPEHMSGMVDVLEQRGMETHA